MKYFLDTEFIEGTQTKRTFFGSIKETKPTIDLISIGIVAEDGREYYAISKDFNLKEAWNRYQINTHLVIGGKVETVEYWIRDKVLEPIFDEFYIEVFDTQMPRFTYEACKFLINTIGKSNKQIADEVKAFCNDNDNVGYSEDNQNMLTWKVETESVKEKIVDYNISKIYYKGNTQFYTYYGAYDWVVFCWLFGKMIDLPKGFPMFSRDLKVMLDDKVIEYYSHAVTPINHTYKESIERGTMLKSCLKLAKGEIDYPKDPKEHNALADAKWNKELYEFLNTL